MENILSEKIINRLTQYHSILREYSKKDTQFITSSQIAGLLNIDETQVRKDIKQINCKGKCKVGYRVNELKDIIEEKLGYKIVKKAFVVGSGNLGIALSKYSKFPEFGLEIMGLFDVDKSKIGKKINGKEIFALEEIENKIKEYNVNIAILTTPNKVAQSTADYIIKAGIKYIWNFAPSVLIVPEDVKVRHENLIGSFIQFCAISNRN